MKNLIGDPNQYKMLEKLHLLINEVPTYQKQKLNNLFHIFNGKCIQVKTITDYNFFKYVLETIRLDAIDKLEECCKKYNLNFDIFYNGKAFINKKINDINIIFLNSIKSELIRLKDNRFYTSINSNMNKINMLTTNDFIIYNGEEKPYKFTNKAFAIIKE